MTDQQIDNLLGKLERIAAALERMDRRAERRDHKLTKMDRAMNGACSAIGRVADALEVERAPAAQVVKR